MIYNRKTFFLGLFIFLIPFFGFPSSWKMAMTIASGLVLMALSAKFEVKKPIRQKRKEKPFKSVAVQHETTETETSDFSQPDIK